MQRNFLASVNFTLAREGLYQCARSDDGNWTLGRVGAGALVGTMRGISAPTMGRWLGDVGLVTSDVMKGVSSATMQAISAALYWRPLSADALPDGVDLMLFDFGFNSGLARAAKQLQIMLGFGGDDLDGNIGVETLARLEEFNARELEPWISVRWVERLQRDLGVTDDGLIGPMTLAAIRDRGERTRTLIYALASRQEAAYRSFRTFCVDGDGWLARLDARVAASIALLEAAPAS